VKGTRSLRHYPDISMKSPVFFERPGNVAKASLRIDEARLLKDCPARIFPRRSCN
jgi:hypothetical protein